jgi:two-component system cell cycle sensor histidine kinase/response regulator CckA
MANDESAMQGAGAGPVRATAPDALEIATDPMFRTLADSLSDNLILLDREGRIRYINYTVPDLTKAQVLGTLVYDYVPPEYREITRRYHERVFETAQPGRSEAAYVSSDGETSLWELRASPVVRDGKVVGLVQLSSNMTERRQAAAERDRLFNLSIDMLCVAGTDGFFKRINPAFEHTLGHGEDELLSRPLLEFVHADDRRSTQDTVERLAKGEVVLDFENRFRCRDGSYRWISWRASSDAAGRQIYSIGRDVTAHRELEQQLRQSQKLQAVGRLAGGVAHDFNNLVLAIELNAHLARAARDDATRASCLAEIEKATQRAADLTRQLLAFARRRPVTLAPIDLSLAIEGMLTMLRRLIPESIEIRFVPARGLPPIMADAAQLEQIVLNLCLNARDAMPSGGVLTIETHVRPDTPAVRLRVRDTGEGIAPEVRDRIFEPFFTTKPQGRGTGLGLATVYGIVEQHGGRIEMETELGSGTTFEIALPATERVPAESVAHDRATTEGARGDETVLVAEDEPGVRGAIVNLLRNAGYRVLVASDGEQALQLFEQHAAVVDLLLFDVVMPRLSGPDAAERVRLLRADVPVVFMSGYSAAHGGGTALLPGSSHVEKPFQPRALLAMVREVLDAAH